MNGSTWVFGHNGYGELALGVVQEKVYRPKKNPLLNGMEIITGGNHIFVIDSAGNVFAVGFNEDGHLGLGHNHSHIHELHPVKDFVQLKRLTNVKSARNIATSDPLEPQQESDLIVLPGLIKRPFDDTFEPDTHPTKLQKLE
jgi:alpha-tubulin suppressor-like RCC1 family protein